MVFKLGIFSGSEVIRTYLLTYFSHPRCNREARLAGIAVAVIEWFDFKTDVPCGQSDMVRITHPEIDMTNILSSFVQNAKVVARNKASGCITVCNVG